MIRGINNCTVCGKHIFHESADYPAHELCAQCLGGVVDLAASDAAYCAATDKLNHKPPQEVNANGQ